MSAAEAAARAGRGMWARAERRWPLVVAGLLGLAAVGVVVALVVPVVANMPPGGNRVGVDRSAAEDVTAASTRSWYDATTADGLATELATALEGTDWCAGWTIAQSYSATGAIGTDQVDRGSNLGVDRRVRACTQWVEVMVVYAYTGSTSQLEDNAELWVTSSSRRVANDLADQEAFTVSPDELLQEDLGRNDSDVIGDAIAALPLALAELGEVDPLTVQPVGEGTPPAEGVEFADREGWGGNDAWRAERTTILAGAIVALLGLAGLCLALVRLRPPPAAVNPRKALKAALAGGGAGARRQPTPTPPHPQETT